MNAYKNLSYYYDEMMEIIDYEDWYNFITPYLKHKSTILDLACGTGTLLTLLANDDHLCYGLDLSDTAILIAHEKAKMNHLDINYKICDMECFNYDIKFNLITCFFDSINFLDKTKITNMINSVYDNLKDGGYFIFDLFTKNKMHSFNNTTLKFPLSTAKYKWKMKVKKNTLYHNITIYDNKMKIKEKYIENYYDYNDILDDRFKVIKIVTDFKDELDLINGERILVVLQK